MKIPILVLFLVLSGTHGGAVSGNDFDRMKTLVGQWESTGLEGKVRIAFELISNGTALMETVGAGSENMVSIYHPDGECVLMTHYCSAGNQPRMRAEKSGGDSITFQFVDVSNLKGSEHGYMRRLVIKFQDADHVIEQWTWKENGQEKVSVFNLRRIK